MFRLNQWYLEESYDGTLFARGSVEGHYRLRDGEYIHTSPVKGIYAMGNGEYLFETASGNLYQVQEKEIRQVKEEKTRELMGEQGISSMEESGAKERLELIRSIFEKKQEAVSQGVQWAQEKLKDGELYLIMEGSRVVKAYFKYEGKAEAVEVYKHVGMHTDSVLVTDWQNGRVDFRYFPESDMRPYHWSDGLENIYINNIGSRVIYFQGTEETISCPEGEIVKIGHDVYSGEGLFSPDAVNGKSVFVDS